MLRRVTSSFNPRPLAALVAGRSGQQRRNFFTFIDTATTGVKTTFGKAGSMFSETTLLKPGFHVYMPFLQGVYKVSNRQQQSTYTMTVKTKDNATCDIDINVQTKIKPDNTELAFFSLDDPHEQIRSYIEGVIISDAPRYDLDELFTEQGKISHKINETLVDRLEEFGFTVVATQITAIQPVKEVVNSMNRINASERLMKAAENEANAEYVKEVRGAEARAEAKRLQGEGISNMRKAILDGYGESVEDLTKSYGLAPGDVLNFLLDIQRLETLDAVGTADNQNRVIFTSMEGHSDKLRNSIMEARAANK